MFQVNCFCKHNTSKSSFTGPAKGGNDQYTPSWAGQGRARNV